MGAHSSGWHVIERCPFPVLATEGEQHVLVDANPAFCLLSGMARETLVGRSLAAVVARCAANGDLVAALDRVYGTGTPETVSDVALRGSECREFRWTYAVWPVLNGSARPIGLMVQAADTSLAVALDKGRERADTEMREMNQALVVASIRQHEYAEAARDSEALVKASEEQNRQAAVLEERNRIAREIHDTLAQVFTAMLLRLQVAQRIAEERPDEARVLIERVCELAREGLAEARRSVWTLQPDAQENSDLAGALARVVERMDSEASAHIELHIQGTPQLLAPDAGMSLIRIAQEALNNASRHAGAQLIWVDLAYEAERVLLRVQDDGCGFDPVREDSGGFGLISMRQRADRLGGYMTIASRPGRGTEVAVSLPIRHGAVEGNDERR